MDRKDVKKRLYAYPNLDRYIDDYEEELRSIQDKIKAHRDVGTSSMSLSGIHGTDVSNPTLNKVIKIDKLQEEYEKRIDYIAEKVKKYYKEKKEIEDALELLSAMQRNIIESRYFKHQQWEEVRTDIDDYLSQPYFRNEGDRAIKTIQAFWEKTL